MIKSADFEYKKERLPDGRVVYRKVHKNVKAEGDPNPRHRETGTDSLANVYKKDTPGQSESVRDARYMDPVPWETQEAKDPGKSPQTYKDVRKVLSGIREQNELDSPPVVEKKDDNGCACGGNCQCNSIEEELEITEAEYQGRKVTLNKPFRTPSGPKKFSVYVKNENGNVVKVNFGSPEMRIKDNIPGRRKNFRARHRCDSDPRAKDKTTPKYWSCRQWSNSKSDI